MKIALNIGIIIIVFILGIAVGDICVSKIIEKEYKNQKKLSYYYFIFNQWLLFRQNGYTLVGDLKEQGFKRVAIYGIAEFGQRLYSELNEYGIEVEYIIDNNPNAYFYSYEILSINDEFPPVDAIIVTPILQYKEIERTLRDKVDCPIISLEMLIINSSKVGENFS